MSTEVRIHPTAVVETGATLGVGVQVGPFSYIGPDAVLGDKVEIADHVTVIGATSLGANCKVASHAALGGPPQNVRHGGGRTTLAIGENTVIREFVTMNTGSDSSRGETLVGANGFFLAYSHVGHDCVVGRNAVFANNATLGGHCDIGDNVGIGGLSAVHQFVRIGDGAFIAGCTAISGDVGPYAIARGNPARLRGLNVVGLRRSGLGAADIRELRSLYQAIFDRASPMSENLPAARRRFGASEKGAKILDFFEVRGRRQFTVAPVGGSGEDADDD
jgi:UDP-N-acetylglucosamine acyltransferase